MRQDRRTQRSGHHADPAQPIHDDHHRRVPLLSADRPADHLLRHRKKVSVAVLRVVGTSARHRIRYRFQVRDSRGSGSGSEGEETMDESLTWRFPFYYSCTIH